MPKTKEMRITKPNMMNLNSISIVNNTSRILFLASVICVISLVSCEEGSENLTASGIDKFTALEISAIPENASFHDTTYVAIYSEIYNKTKDSRFNLTATLSLRNTSFTHSIYISAVDYYNSAGERIKMFLENPIELKPMQSMEYVIEEKDKSGGTGANFIINWAADSPAAEPIFEGIMISTNGQQGISFTSTGVSISNK
jgi:hypothetical protein